MLRIGFTLLISFFLLQALASAQDAPKKGPEYSVDLSQVITHYVTVTADFESDSEETILMMPTWTPGSYLVREYARHVDRITAKDLRDNEIPIEKVSKNRWLVKNGGRSRFEVTYRIFCDETSVRTNSVDFNRAILVGAATFLTIPEQMDREHRVHLEFPKHWSVSASSMRTGKTENDYVAENYDELVDSPIVAGNVIKYPFEVAGVPHYLVNVEQSGNWDAEKATADLAKMVAEHHRLWGEVPYDRYFFLNVFTGGGGGLEHNNCCLLMTGRFDVRNEGSYKRWLGLCSHEFFHAWNIRRLRPTSLVKYDYENEVYTPSLWIAEGITSYYEDLLLARAGLITEEDFISSFGNTIAAVQRTEGRLVQSLKDSSHDAWIKFYRPAGNSADTQISYYTKGAVVGFLLDSEIRSASGGAKSLDDVLRELWVQCRETGYNPEDFRRLCNEAAGKDLEEWFRVAVDSSEELDYQVASNWYGLDIGDVKPQSGDEVEENEETQTSSRSSRTLRGRPWIGIGEFDSPATNAGLADTDEVIAINSRRVSGSLDTELQDFKVGDPIKVLIARNGELQEILLVVGSRPARPTWNLKVTRRPADEQKAHLDAWLGVAKVNDDTTEAAVDEAAPEPPADEAKSDEVSSEREAAGEEKKEGDSAPDVQTDQVESPEATEAAGESSAEASDDDGSGNADGESSTGEGGGTTPAA